MKQLLLLAALITVSGAGAQTINMPASGSTTACSGNFYDSGGSGGNYANSENRTYTICPSTAGMSLQVNFTSFNIESGWDYLYIYDGNSVGAPLIGTYTGTTSPGTITATSATGCLTFRFTSDGSVNYAGWAAAISCVPPPPPSINMSNGSTSTCSATFYDSGGSSGTYSANQTLVYTICPATAGAKISANFTMFNLENNYDFLEIFDGNSVFAPSLGVYTGTSGPGTAQATPSNATGCLTFRFTSDGSVQYAGWAASISCVTPCQSITANFLSSTPAPGGDGIIRLCQGQSLSMSGSGTFSVSGAGASYSWTMGNGATASGASSSYTYPAPGSYLLNLNITDPLGCMNTNSINRIVQVSTTPTITTSATPSTLCTNQYSTLNASVTMNPYTVNCTPPVSGTTFLPDGSGVSYTTSITTNCYTPGATITSANDFQNLCINMEHSYLGDLSMRFICPNGQSMVLKAYPGGGGTYLGGALDDGTTNPGTGATYCFTPSASTLLVNGPTVIAGSPAGNSIAPGNYMPVDPFSNLIGCPLNGTWTIEITDNLAIDNGYIFNWDFNLNAALSIVPSFTPTIVSQGWVPAPNLTQINSTQASVLPTSMGTPCFNYSVTDNFGCTYTQPQCITVNCTSLPVGLVSFDATAISRSRVLLDWITESELDNDYFVVERSQSGQDHWEFVAQVDGAGNSVQQLEYAAVDEHPYIGLSYYRLRQVDFDGSEQVTDIDAVLISGAGSGLLIYPNPATDLVAVEGNAEDLEAFELLNAVGQNVKAMVPVILKGTTKIELDLSSLAKGTYVFRSGDLSYLIVKK